MMSVRVSPVSKTAALLILALGILMLVAGLSTGVAINTVAGVAITALGVALYIALRAFTAKVRREIERGPSSKEAAQT
jgi:membrane protein implicated in regulation of membrane protease activity